MSDTSLDIDVAGATAALEAAGGMPETVPASTSGVDPWNRDPSGQHAAQPVEGAPEGQAPGTEAPAATPEGTATEGEPFTHIDPSNLPPELQQLYRSMQADYTRKTTEVAPWRKVAEEIGVESPDQIREALTVYQRLQDPSQWAQIHKDLGQYMQSVGMSPQAATEAATEAIAQFAPAEEPDFSEYEGTELGAVLSAMKQQQAQLAQLQSQIQAQEQERAQQLRFQQVASHLEKQEVALRASRPDYDETDFENIYTLMGEDADLSAAAARYESMLGARLQRYLQGKEGAMGSLPTPLAGGGVVTNQQPESRPEDVDPIDWGHRQALAQIRAIERAEAQS